MEKTEKREEGKCMICKGPAEPGKKICECCLESLALCDMENYLARKTVGKIYGANGSNAFK